MARPAAMVLRGRALEFGTRTYVMGIVNVTPDSFSGDGILRTSHDGSLAPPRAHVAAAVGQARQMVADGADLIDIGGESTRPGHQVVTEQVELSRVIEAVAAVREALPDTPISIDTSKPAVASAALEAGADIVNDITAVTAAAGLAEVAAAHAAPYVLMHDRAEPVYDDLVGEVLVDLDAALRSARAAGCAPETLIVDPGIGFGKTAAQNLELLAHLGELRRLGQPILLGTSRKSTIGHVLDLPPDERLEGTLATTALGVAAGVDIVRVHDVRANVRVARMSDAIVRGWRQDPSDDPPDRPPRSA